MSWARRSSRARFGPSTSAVTGSLHARIDAPDDPAGPADRDRVQGHAQVAGQDGRLLGVERLGDGRLVVAVGQEHEHLLLGRRDQECIESHRDRIADVRAVVARPRRAHRVDGSSKKAWSRVGGHASSG